AGGSVEDAPHGFGGARAELRRERQDRRGEMRRIRWVAVLVGDDAQLGAFAREAKHGQKKVVAVGTVEPGGAQDRVVWIGRSDRLFARKLGAAVDGGGGGGGVLRVGLRRGTGGDVGRRSG